MAFIRSPFGPKDFALTDDRKQLEFKSSMKLEGLVPVLLSQLFLYLGSRPLYPSRKEVDEGGYAENLRTVSKEFFKLSFASSPHFFSFYKILENLKNNLSQPGQDKLQARLAIIESSYAEIADDQLRQRLIKEKQDHFKQLNKENLERKIELLKELKLQRISDGFFDGLKEAVLQAAKVSHQEEQELLLAPPEKSHIAQLNTSIQTCADAEIERISVAEQKYKAIKHKIPILKVDSEQQVLLDNFRNMLDAEIRSKHWWQGHQWYRRTKLLLFFTFIMAPPMLVVGWYFIFPLSAAWDRKRNILASIVPPNCGGDDCATLYSSTRYGICSAASRDNDNFFASNLNRTLLTEDCRFSVAAVCGVACDALTAAGGMWGLSLTGIIVPTVAIIVTLIWFFNKDYHKKFPGVERFENKSLSYFSKAQDSLNHLLNTFEKTQTFKDVKAETRVRSMKWSLTRARLRFFTEEPSPEHKLQVNDSVPVISTAESKRGQKQPLLAGGSVQSESHMKKYGAL